MSCFTYTFLWLNRSPMDQVLRPYEGRESTTNYLPPEYNPLVKPVRTPVAIFGSLGVCIYVLASRHWLISYSPIHLT